MESSARSFLDALLSRPGVSGYEQAVQQIVRDYVSPFADEIETDLHGNVIGAQGVQEADIIRFGIRILHSAQKHICAPSIRRPLLAVERVGDI